MASNVRIFIAGVGTTFVMLALGFGGGLMLTQGGKEPPARAHAAASLLPPVRVILPASAEAATPEQAPAQTAEAAPSPVAPAREAQQAPERDYKVDQAEHRKTEVNERLRRKKIGRA